MLSDIKKDLKANGLKIEEGEDRYKEDKSVCYEFGKEVPPKNISSRPKIFSNIKRAFSKKNKQP